MEKTALSVEIYWLIMTVIMTGLFWVPYIINRLREEGVGKALWNPNADPGPKAAWAQRMMAAHENAVENLVIFAPLVITVQLLGVNSNTTAMACLVYFVARLLHYIVFTLGVPVMRVITFVIGVAAQVTLALEIIKSL